MPYLVKRVETPQTIYILGEGFTNSPGTGFGITDDYNTLEVTNGSEIRLIDTVGWVEVYTEEELVAAIPNIDETYDANEDWNQEVIVLEDFVGDVILKLVAEEDNDEFGIKEGDDILEGYDPNNYETHHALYTYDKRLWQKDGGCAVERDLLLVLPEGTKMSKELRTQKVIEPLKEKYNIIDKEE